ncbi:MAG: hypothetical protein ACLFPF_07235 [Halanaerobiales bacterium]
MHYVFTQRFNGISIPFYESRLFSGEYIGEPTLYIKRSDMGRALGYSCPVRSTSKLHSMHKDQLDKYSVKTAVPDGRNITGRLETVMYDAVSVNIYCNISKQPLAQEFCEWVTKWL